MRTLMQDTVPGTSSAGLERAVAVAGHVLHFAVKSRREPLAKMRFVLAKIDSGHRDLAEAEFRAPGVDVLP